MSQPGCSRDVAVASTPYDPVLVMPAGQVVMQRTIRRIRPVINISLHEPGIGADPRGQAPRLPHRRSGEIQSRHRGTEGPAAPATPCRCRCDTAGAHRAARRWCPAGKVEPDDIAEEIRIGSVPLQLVIRGCCMSRNALIPAGPVDCPIVVLHAGTIPPAGRWKTSRRPEPPPEHTPCRVGEDAATCTSSCGPGGGQVRPSRAACRAAPRAAGALRPAPAPTAQPAITGRLPSRTYQPDPYHHQRRCRTQAIQADRRECARSP